MRALINGAEGATQKLFAGQDASWLVMLLADDGSLVNVTGDTVTLAFYDRADRRNAATLTVTAAITTAASGLCTATITDTNTGTLTTGQTYYIAVKRDAGGAGAYSFGALMSSVQVQ